MTTQFASDPMNDLEIDCKRKKAVQTIKKIEYLNILSEKKTYNIVFFW